MKRVKKETAGGGEETRRGGGEGEPIETNVYGSRIPSSLLLFPPLLSSRLLSLGEHCSSIQQLAEPRAFLHSDRKENRWRAAALIFGGSCAMQHHTPSPSQLESPPLIPSHPDSLRTSLRRNELR